MLQSVTSGQASICISECSQSRWSPQEAILHIFKSWKNSRNHYPCIVACESCLCAPRPASHHSVSVRAVALDAVAPVPPRRRAAVPPCRSAAAAPLLVSGKALSYEYRR
eukprot:1856613-Pleurochrysis_carterae.AAC.1